MLGNRVVGILRESGNKWERRAPLTPAHCARLLHGAGRGSGVDRIIIQPCTRRIHPDTQYEDVGCEISEDLSECGLILGIKQPKLENIWPDRAYAFFSHTHKAQLENMPLLDKVLSERVSLYDYELIVGENGKRLLAFGKYAGNAGMIDFLRGLGERLLNLGYSTPFLSLGSSYMYSSLSAAKAAVIAVGEEIATSGLPSAICPLIFVFTGLGNVSQGAQEIFRLLPHTFVDSSELPQLTKARNSVKGSKVRQNFQVYGCVVTSKDMVAPKDPSKAFDKVDYYSHPELYDPVFHERIAPYASVIVNCMYWEKRFPRLLTNKNMQDLMRASSRLVGVADITCDIGGSIECLSHATTIERPFFRYDPLTGTYHDDMIGEGIIFLAIDILPTELPKEATKHFGDVLSQFLSSMASAKGPGELLAPVRRACIAHKGELTPLYDYIKRMRQSDSMEMKSKSLQNVCDENTYKTLISLNGHLFDQFLINEALDIIEGAGGSFHLVRCQLGQTSDAVSYAEIEVSANDRNILAKIVDSLASIANIDNPGGNKFVGKEVERSSQRIAEANHTIQQMEDTYDKKSTVLILGAGHVCTPAVEFLALNDFNDLGPQLTGSLNSSTDTVKDVEVIVASLYLQDALKVIEGIPNTTAVELDINDHNKLIEYISKADVVVSLLPASCHMLVADACIKLRKHLVTASYVDKNMSDQDERAKNAGVTILCEMGLDPGIDHMMAMKMINQAHLRGGKVCSFVSYCGGLPSPAAANNPLGYKFSWSPAGAIKAGRNPAVYIADGQMIRVNGENLYDSAKSLHLPNLPAFALERLPNRDSLVYGDYYGITGEASTIFRATLRYEGFSEIMGSLSKLGFFESGIHPMLNKDDELNHLRPTFKMFLQDLFRKASKDGQTLEDVTGGEHNTAQVDITEKLVIIGVCQQIATANKVASCIRFLGLDDNERIPEACKSAFDVICLRMEERLVYSPNEQDMVLLHHELDVKYEDNRPSEHHAATLLEFGKTANEKPQSAMARTVGIPAAIGAKLLLDQKITTRGVLRPLEPEVYFPALETLDALGVHIHEETTYVDNPSISSIIYVYTFSYSFD